MRRSTARATSTSAPRSPPGRHDAIAIKNGWYPTRASVRELPCASGTARCSRSCSAQAASARGRQPLKVAKLCAARPGRSSGSGSRAWKGLSGSITTGTGLSLPAYRHVTSQRDRACALSGPAPDATPIHATRDRRPAAALDSGSKIAMDPRRGRGRSRWSRRTGLPSGRSGGAFPDVDGELSLPGPRRAGHGLPGRPRGIPQVYAAERGATLFESPGATRAQDRFWEMDFRRHADCGPACRSRLPGRTRCSDRRVPAHVGLGMPGGRAGSGA